MIVCLEGISEECVLFNVNVDASLKLLWALGRFSDENQAIEDSEVTWKALGHVGTWAFKALRHSSTQGTWALIGHLGTCALKHSRYSGSWARGNSTHFSADSL